MRIVDLAEKGDADLHYELVGFPSDLPDFSKLKPPHNHRKAGLDAWAARCAQRPCRRFASEGPSR